MQLEIKLKKEDNNVILNNNIVDTAIKSEIEKILTVANSKMPGVDNKTMNQVMCMLLESLVPKFFNGKNVKVDVDSKTEELILTINNI